MKRYLLALLIASLLCLIGDSFLGRVSTSFISDTFSEPYLEEATPLAPISSLSRSSLETISDTSLKYSSTTPVTLTSGTSVATPYHYTVTSYQSSIISSGLSYSDIYRTGNLIYAHNTPELLGSIKDLTPGSTFTVTESGITSTYLVRTVAIFEKADDYTLRLCRSGYSDCSGSYHMDTLSNATLHSLHYSLALFTCDGTALGGGKATHRRIVFADKI